MREIETEPVRFGPLSKQYGRPECTAIHCPVECIWLPIEACSAKDSLGVNCCDDYISTRNDGENIVIECRA